MGNSSHYPPSHRPLLLPVAMFPPVGQGRTSEAPSLGQFTVAAALYFGCSLCFLGWTKAQHSSVLQIGASRSPRESAGGRVGERGVVSKGGNEEQFLLKGVS